MGEKIKVELQISLTGHKDAIYALEKAKGMTHFFSAAGDGMVIEWDAVSFTPGKVIARLPSAIYSLQYQKEKDILFAATRLNGIYALGLKVQKELAHIDLPSAIYDIKLINDDVLVAALADGYLYFISAIDLTILKGHQPTEKHCRKIAFSGSHVATGWSDNFIRIYDAVSFEEIHSFEAHQNSVFAVCYTKKGELLLSGSRDAQLKQWSAEKNYELVKTVPAHLFTINEIKENAEKNLVATASRDKTLKIWDPDSLELLKVMDAEKGGHTHSVNSLLWLNDNYLISCGDDKTIKVWKID